MESQHLIDKLEHALVQLEGARPFNKARFQGAVIELSGRLLAEPGGIETLFRLAPRYDEAGLFAGTPWDHPATLLPGLVRNTLEQGDRTTVVIEILSELRLLALGNGAYTHQGVPAEQARHFLTQVLALNLDQLLGAPDEVMRVRLGKTGAAVTRVFQFLLDNIGFEDILGSLVEEIWRVMSQRPIKVDSVKSMVTQIALARANGVGASGDSAMGADRLTSALFAPTVGCIDDPGIPVYTERLGSMDNQALQQEAYGFARAMRDVGLVSDYHAVFLRWLLENGQDFIVADALGLSSTGLDALRTYQQLVFRLIEGAVYPQSAQCIYSLAMMLESGILYAPPIAPGLWRQIDLQLSSRSRELLSLAFGDSLPPEVRLLSGIIAILGQPLGIGQGNNPTCQSARAISLWAYNDPDFLLHLITRVARFDEIVMHFEGEAISSEPVASQANASLPLDTDPVSVLLVPHLDFVYHEMGARCASRGDDPHRWVNPEFHGWWVGRAFFLAVELANGRLSNYEAFVSRFYQSFHPYCNGNQPIIHPQPAGLAITDSNGTFIGWHAITLIRIALDQENVMRVYFFNPNNDSGQDWGGGVVVSTHGHGERYGESSLPFAQLVSRLYLFHDDSEPIAPSKEPDTEELESVKRMALASWAATREPEVYPQP